MAHEIGVNLMLSRLRLAAALSLGAARPVIIARARHTR